MARPQCMAEDGEQAVFVGTMLTTGDGFNLCEEHFAMWCAAMLQTMTGIDPTPFIAAISDPDSVPEALGVEGVIPDQGGLAEDTKPQSVRPPLNPPGTPAEPIVLDENGHALPPPGETHEGAENAA